MLLKVHLTSLTQSWYNKNVTRLTTQGCNNIIITWLYQICWNNLATSLIISTRLLQVVNSLFRACWQLGTSSANTTCWRLVGRLATRCEIFACVLISQEEHPRICLQETYIYVSWRSLIMTFKIYWYLACFVEERVVFDTEQLRWET